MKKNLLLISVFSFILLSYASAQTVYITKSGKKYHSSDCRYLSSSAIPIDISEAQNRGYDACKVCKPSGGHDTSDEFYDNKTNQKVQCSALTKKGIRCKRMTDNSNGKCWQHQGD